MDAAPCWLRQVETTALLETLPVQGGTRPGLTGAYLALLHAAPILSSACQVVPSNVTLLLQGLGVRALRRVWPSRPVFERASNQITPPCRACPQKPDELMLLQGRGRELYARRARQP